MPGRFPVVLSAVVLTACTSSNQTTGEAQVALVSENGEPLVQPAVEGLICERRSVTGSRITKRICYSREEYDAMRSYEQRVTVNEINERRQHEINQSAAREAMRAPR